MADNNNDLVGVESDPTKRYIRFNKMIGKGATTKVYLGFDEYYGMEVAWCKTQLTQTLLSSKETVKTLCAEAHLLESLEHDNIVKCYHSWIDEDNKIIHMITELLNSGSLDDYIHKYHVVNIMAIKNWCRQILEGLHYLHRHDPPVIHRDVKCENIFINGNTGKVKLGDFGLATTVSQKPMTIVGTPQFMAPELKGSYYDQLADIYSFGMSVLQMVTRKLPYIECCGKAHNLDKIKFDLKPVSQETDSEVKEFIRKCLAPASNRPSALVLLNDPFLAPNYSVTSSCLSLREPLADEVDKLLRKKFQLQGQMNDDNVSIFMELKNIELLGHDKKIRFQYSLKDDKVESVMESMAENFPLSTEDVKQISEQMEDLLKDVCSSGVAQRALDVSSEQDQACSQQYQDEEQEHGESETELKRQQEVQEREGEDTT